MLAFDPGTATVGWAVLHARGDRVKLADCGALRTSKDEIASQRLRQIHEGVEELIQAWKPDVMALERLFFAKNQTTALKVGQAVGVILLAAAQSEIPAVEYTPPQVKMAVVGEGNAEKQQVQYMVTRILKLDKAPKPDDVADACAIAICHANSRKLKALAGESQS
ncbi:MAG: crossover junction endodeoxyribonuclease RuvC [Armatimonadetes bacterium]|nr:crossover junction endodeoxyribonuclease RuvC [Armatimonadota bacterium]